MISIEIKIELSLVLCPCFLISRVEVDHLFVGIEFCLLTLHKMLLAYKIVFVLCLIGTNFVLCNNPGLMELGTQRLLYTRELDPCPVPSKQP